MEVAAVGQEQIIAVRTQSSPLSGDAVAMLPTSRHTLHCILIGLRMAWAPVRQNCASAVPAPVNGEVPGGQLSELSLLVCKRRRFVLTL